VAERMTRALRWQHGLVMASFPVLVYTGFALTYPERWWAAPFVGFEGRWVLRGALHRAAAVVMVIGLGWHVAHVASNRRVRRCFRRLLPSPRDLAGLGGALAYYLGRQAHPPHNGTFNYAEKAEYWAFMWGSILMAVTGGLLWFHDATLQWLPGWVPDVATALHFYEAVLATLAILVWHLYWVIFDPLVYPMDWSWRTGRPPAARALERGPEAELEPEAEPQPERADD
jgi:cytochrome b subunit of formate dehydrogenase